MKPPPPKKVTFTKVQKPRPRPPKKKPPAPPKPLIISVAIDKKLKDVAQEVRAATDEQAVADYAEAIDALVTLPPVECLQDGEGNLWMYDGHHRLLAHQKAGKVTIQAKIENGDEQAARLRAAKANISHGLRRSNDDKRAAVLVALRVAAEWSNRRLAAHCGVSDPFVAGVRQVLTVSTPARTSAPALPSQVATVATSDGASNEEPREVAQAEPARRLGADGKSYPATRPPPRPVETVKRDEAAPRPAAPPAPVAAAAPAVARDATGRPLPPELVTVFEVVPPQLEAAHKALLAAAKALEEIPEKLHALRAGGKLPPGDVLHCLAHLPNPDELRVQARRVARARPHAVCAHCKGTLPTCNACKGGWWLDEEGYKRVPAEIRDSEQVQQPLALPGGGS